MCIVIDTCTFASVFDSSSDKHSNFVPVLNWVRNGKGKIVYGGTKYKRELKLANKYFKILVEFKKTNKIVEIDDEQVDLEQQVLEDLLSHRDFDDAHLVSIIIVSGCKLICSEDKRAFPFLQNKDLYPKNINTPKIYSGRKSNRALLNDKNITSICKGC